MGGIAVTAAAAALRVGAYVDASAIALLVELLIVTPDLTAARPAVPTGAPRRVLLLNVHTESTAYGEVRALIAETQPDVVALVEVSPEWLAQLAPALGGYRGRIEAPRDDNFGLALYAREAVTGTVEELGGGMPSIVATSGGASYIVTHPLPPMTSRALELQRSQFAAIAERRARFGGSSPRAGSAIAARGSGCRRAIRRGPRRCASRSTTRWSRARSGWRIGRWAATWARTTSRW